jgi:hypothetical protein
MACNTKTPPVNHEPARPPAAKEVPPLLKQWEGCFLDNNIADCEALIAHYEIELGKYPKQDRPNLVRHPEDRLCDLLEDRIGALEDEAEEEKLDEQLSKTFARPPAGTPESLDEEEEDEYEEEDEDLDKPLPPQPTLKLPTEWDPNPGCPPMDVRLANKPGYVTLNKNGWKKLFLTGNTLDKQALFLHTKKDGVYQGIRLAGVQPCSALRALGLKGGDILRSRTQKEANKEAEMKSLIDAIQDAKQRRLVVDRDGALYYVFLVWR